MNLLVWELEEVQQLTRFAAQHHVQIVPLVQGLGHVSYILKHPEYRHLRELFQLLQDGALFWYDTFERRVWHYGDVGLIHLPDLPRGDIEFHPFWRRRYAPLLNRAREEHLRIARAIEILDDNLALGPRHAHDLEGYLERLKDYNASY